MSTALEKHPRRFLTPLPATIYRRGTTTCVRGATLFKSSDGKMIESDVPLLHLLMACAPAKLRSVR